MGVCFVVCVSMAAERMDDEWRRSWGPEEGRRRGRKRGKGEKNADVEMRRERWKNVCRYCRFLALVRSFRATSAENAFAPPRCKQEKEKQPLKTRSSAAEREEGMSFFPFLAADAKRDRSSPSPSFPLSPSSSPHSLCSLCRIRGLPVDTRRVVGRATVGAARSRRALLANSTTAGTAAAAAALLGRRRVIDQPLVAEEADLVVALAEAQAELGRVELLGTERALERVEVYEDHEEARERYRFFPFLLSTSERATAASTTTTTRVGRK